jgi:hypothetical protein
MEQVEEVVAAYCKRLRAPTPKPRDDGSYLLRFENKFEVMVTPEGRDRMMLRSDLPRLTRGRDRHDTVERLMRINLLLSGRKRSTLTLDEAADTPFLYDLVTVDTADPDSNHRSITAFVNEVAAFHKALERSH